jgi:hypothetical protein
LVTKKGLYKSLRDYCAIAENQTNVLDVIPRTFYLRTFDFNSTPEKLEDLIEFQEYSRMVEGDGCNPEEVCILNEPDRS